MFIDNFESDCGAVPTGLSGAEADRYVLLHSKRISIFWITETQARAKRIKAWEDAGYMKLLGTSDGWQYPWYGIDYFVPYNPTLDEIATEIPPSSFRHMAEQYDHADIRRMVPQLEAAGMRMLLLAEYLDTRSGGDGCGRKPHEDGAKALEKLHKQLRKAVGYSCPGSGVLKL